MLLKYLFVTLHYPMLHLKGEKFILKLFSFYLEEN